MLVVCNGTDAPLHVSLSSELWSIVLDGLESCSPPLAVNGVSVGCLGRVKRNSRHHRTRLALSTGKEKMTPWLVNLPRKQSKAFCELACGREWPWRVYATRVGDEQRVLVLPKRELSCFLRELDDGLPLSSLILPGTHQTMALYGWPHSKCQELRLDQQLERGIRVLDIRLSNANFKDIVNDVLSFLNSPAGISETVVMSVKPEDDSPLFNGLVWQHVQASRSQWFLDNRIPTLGEVRGKIVMFSRFGGSGWPDNVGIGIHPPQWPDNVQQGFDWTLGDTIMRVQDWYSIPSFLSIPEKMAAATSSLVVPHAPGTPPTLNISFFSASSALALPPTVALGAGYPGIGLGFRGVNERAANWLVNQLSAKGGEDLRLRGWALLDFFESPEKDGESLLCSLLVECNWRGRVSGEEGWQMLPQKY
ncbi:PLC-like phosphodiesterase [Auriculariales sp. MPI-PUGE-AT-0066]|nr:PLC-like phosphodiesterase [Auriculariales sp. MPI-PUGE-AT-0066]